MGESMSLPFGMSWEVLVMILAFGVLAIIVFANPQFMERILSFIKGGLQ